MPHQALPRDLLGPLVLSAGGTLLLGLGAAGLAAPTQLPPLAEHAVAFPLLAVGLLLDGIGSVRLVQRLHASRDGAAR